MISGGKFMSEVSAMTPEFCRAVAENLPRPFGRPLDASDLHFQIAAFVAECGFGWGLSGPGPGAHDGIKVQGGENFLEPSEGSS